MEKPVYWAIVWGDQIDDEPTSGPGHHPERQRRARDKYINPRDACKECFGSVSTNMWVKNLGPNSKYFRVQKRMAAMMDINQGTWMRLGTGSVLFSQSEGPVYWVDGKFYKELPN